MINQYIIVWIDYRGREFVRGFKTFENAKRHILNHFVKSKGYPLIYKKCEEQAND